MSLGEIALGILKLFLLIGHFSRLENLICETLELVTVSGLVLSLGVKNVDAIQEAFKFTLPRPILLVASWSFHHIDRTFSFPLLVMALG
jgi:predicted benzoate:H+ symporter BenE